MFGFLRKKQAEDKELYRFIKNILGYKPGNIFVYKLAFIHKSVSKNTTLQERLHNNERLEYLGDAVLSTIVADFLFKKYPYESEGFLTEMRSKIVSRSNLNKVSQKMGLSKFVQYNKHSSPYVRSIDGDALEALIGAIYIEKGYTFARKIVSNIIINQYMDIDLLYNAEWNFKSKLIDWGQKERKKVAFETVEIIKQGYRKQYKVHALIGGVAQGEGIDFSIKAAEQLAAEKAYKNLVNIQNINLGTN